MLSWLRNWFAQEPYDLYQPKQRRIYSYWNGQEIVRIDPMILYKRIMEVGPELDIDIKLARSISKDAGKGYENMLTKFRKVFDVKALAEDGLTEEETVELFDHFVAFNDSQKKSTKPLATSLASSAASATSSDASPTTGSSTACGSTEGGCSTAKPRPSVAASPLPSA